MTYSLDWPADRLSANVSMLFAELPMLDRADAAASVGFSTIETWWPFPGAEPEPAEVDRVAESILEAGVGVASLNFFTGDKSADERGLPAVRAGEERFVRNVPIALDLGARIGARWMNVLYGNLDASESPADQLRRAAALIAEAARAAADAGIGVMIEPLSTREAPHYALRTIADVRRVIEAIADAGGPPVGICYDVYHLAQEDPAAFGRFASELPLIAHVQLADVPGRGEPGTGELEIPRILSALRDAGYAGFLGLEYLPAGPVTLPRDEPASTT